MKRSGYADLPLHNGRVPDWLAKRMAALGTAISESIVLEYGREELLTRLSDPFWFQALGCVMGMDWHSSGITTSVLGALKRGLSPRADELGIYICGGRGKHSRKTPHELTQLSDRLGFDGDALVRASRLTAKIDNSAIVDGFQIYLHSFIVSKSGEWVVVQQGMRPENGMARRYHWHSKAVRSFVKAPHSGIVGEGRGEIINLVDAQAEPAQRAILHTLSRPPEETLRDIRALVMDRNHTIPQARVDTKRLGAVLAVAYERDLSDFASALLVENLGPRTLQSLALVAEVLHGAPARFSDPARFSFAHGGKDRVPFAVPVTVYDSTVRVLEASLEKARIGERDRLEALKRLHGFVRRVESELSPEADLDALIKHEERLSPELGGRSIFGFEKDRNSRQLIRTRKPKVTQLKLL